ncbi:hypothetical protein ACVIW2_001319 [Bradyrhizobium huanghuaihaiense]
MITTLLPPANGPDVGEIDVTVGVGRLTVMVKDVLVN